MSTIFPLSASVGQTFNGYEFDGTSWNIIGVDLTEDYALDSELAAHEADTTNVHGIADTSVLATETYVNTAISNLVDSAPETLNTLNELAAALNDDANFSASVINHISASTNVHGISDMGELATQSYVDNAISSFQALPSQTGNSGEFLTTDGTNTSWSPVPPSSPVGGGSNKVFYENDIVIDQDYTITSGKNAGSFGPIEISASVTVEIPSGSVWTIV
jgi:hypothetical protein